MPRASHGTLTPNEITGVEITPGSYGIVVINRTRTGVIWCRFDGVDPAVEGEDSFVVFGARTFYLRRTFAPVTVKLLSTEAKQYSVEAE